MRTKLTIGIWVCAIIIVLLSLWFGFSDLMHPWDQSYAARNPMRPVFRLAFGLVMATITLLGAGLATRSAVRK